MVIPIVANYHRTGKSEDVSYQSNYDEDIIFASRTEDEYPCTKPGDHNGTGNRDQGNTGWEKILCTTSIDKMIVIHLGYDLCQEWQAV
ncbi:hypothetical protein KCU83_g694, partial [Aureobasidium melanogenum]